MKVLVAFLCQTAKLTLLNPKPRSYLSWAKSLRSQVVLRNLSTHLLSTNESRSSSSNHGEKAHKVSILLFSLQHSRSKQIRRVNSQLPNLQILITKSTVCMHLLERQTSIWAKQIVKKNCHRLFTLVYNFWMEVHLVAADNPRKLCSKKRKRERERGKKR